MHLVFCLFSVLFWLTLLQLNFQVITLFPNGRVVKIIQFSIERKQNSISVITRVLKYVRLWQIKNRCSNRNQKWGAGGGGGGGGGGGAPYEGGGGAGRKFWKKPLQEINLGVAQAFN